MGSLNGYGRCRRLKVAKLCSYVAFPVHLFRHLCGRTYHLATIHFAADRQTDGRIQTHDIMMTIADHTVWQYDRLKMYN